MLATLVKKIKTEQASINLAQASINLAYVFATNSHILEEPIYKTLMFCPPNNYGTQSFHEEKDNMLDQEEESHSNMNQDDKSQSNIETQEIITGEGAQPVHIPIGLQRSKCS
jgi:hypothetical protein